MPHKRGPFRVGEPDGQAGPTGAGTRIPALENVALWHERDIVPFVGGAGDRAWSPTMRTDFALVA